MKHLHRLLPAVLFCILTWLPGCVREPLSGPPTLRPGRDECAECGMLINDERCSSGLLVEEDGRRTHLLFDDIGCMLDIERDAGGDRVVLDRFVRDHGTKAWIKAGDAIYLFTDSASLSTPMGSGIIAFAIRADAERALGLYGGRLLNSTELAAERKSWLENRYRRPAG